MKYCFKILISILIIFIILFLFLQKKHTDKTEIQFASWGSQSEVALIIPLIKEFEAQNPEIKVKFLHIPQNYFQKIHLLFASNLAPDVIFINNYYVPKYAKAGLLEDLTPYVDKESYFKKSIDSFTVNNKIYAVPRDVSNLVVYYNKDIFDKYNVSYPNQSWTIDDFVKIAKNLTKDTNSDGKLDLWGVSYEKDIFYVLPFIFSNGGRLLDNDARVLVNSKQTIEALDFYSSLSNQYNVAPKVKDSASLTMAQMFLQQKLAMHISGRWLVPKYRNEAQFNWDIVTFPNGSEGSVVNIDSSGYAMSSKTKHKKEALAFIEFISSENSLNRLSQSGLIVPARIRAASSSSFLAPNNKPSNSKAFINAIEQGIPTPVNNNYSKFTDKLNTALEPLFLGHKNAKDVFDKNFIDSLDY